MKTLGNVVHIQRGETWSLDFDVSSVNGAPYMLFKEWRHPYLVITVTAARYEQKGDFRQTWWLDMDQRYVEQADGTFLLVPMKRFIETQPLYTQYHAISQVTTTYGEPFGRITATGNYDDPFDITNYLFFTDPDADGNNSYMYVSEYTVIDNEVVHEKWEEYNFRIIKQFNTKSWTEQNYLFDMKVLAGETIAEHVQGILVEQGLSDLPSQPWNDTITNEQIKRITDKKKRREMQELQDSGVPLMPDFDTKSLILEPTKLIVSANIQGGVR